MKLKGAWGNAVKFIGVAALLCCVVLWTVSVGAGKRGLTGETVSVATGPQRATKPVAPPVGPKDKSAWADAYGRLPMSFEENRGQTAQEVRYVAHGGSYEFEWRFHLGAISAVVPELGRMEQRGEHLADVALFLRKRFRHAVNECERRIIGNEALRQFQRDEMRRLRAGGQHMQDFLALVFAFGLDAVSEHKLGTGLVHARIVAELHSFFGLV